MVSGRRSPAFPEGRSSRARWRPSPAFRDRATIFPVAFCSPGTQETDWRKWAWTSAVNAENFRPTGAEYVMAGGANQGSLPKRLVETLVRSRRGMRRTGEALDASPERHVFCPPRGAVHSGFVHGKGVDALQVHKLRFRRQKVRRGGENAPRGRRPGLGRDSHELHDHGDWDSGGLIGRLHVGSGPGKRKGEGFLSICKTDANVLNACRAPSGPEFPRFFKADGSSNTKMSDASPTLG